MSPTRLHALIHGRVFYQAMDNLDKYEWCIDLVIGKNMSGLKANEIYVELLRCAILEYDPQVFADKFYDYRYGDGQILQIELYGANDGDATCSKRVFKIGTGSHSKKYFDYKGEKYCFHFNCYADFTNESFNFDLKKFEELYTVEFLDWIKSLKNYEEYLQTTRDIEDSICDADDIDAIEIPSSMHFNLDLIQDKLREKFDAHIIIDDDEAFEICRSIFKDHLNHGSECTYETSQAIENRKDLKHNKEMLLKALPYVEATQS